MLHQFIALTAESVGNYQLRFENYQGRQHVIVPCVILVEGVHNGSAGPLYYPVSELSRSPSVWNGVPVTINHPETDSGLASANDPEVMRDWAVGTLFNASFDPEINGIRVELWIDVARCQGISPDTMGKVKNREQIEVSTGLWFDLVAPPGVWNNEEFIGTVANMNPDHLAILPNDRGACSIEDGCGIRANGVCSKTGTNAPSCGCKIGESDLDTELEVQTESEEEDMKQKLNEEGIAKKVLGMIGNLINGSEEDTPGSKIPEGAIVLRMAAHVSKEEIAKALSLMGNETGYLEIYGALQHLADAFDERTPTSARYNFVEDIYPGDTFILRVVTHMENGPSTMEFFRGSFTTDEEGVPTEINDEMVKVRERREFVEMTEGGEVAMSGCGCGEKVLTVQGEALAAFLNRQIDSRTDDDTSRADVIARMANAAGIQSGTVNQILAGEIICPPLNRLEGFGRALNIGIGRIVSAAEGDGCDYSSENIGKEDDQMNKEAIVNSIIACERNGFGEADRDSLLAMEEEVLTKMVPEAANQDAPPGDDPPADDGGGEDEGTETGNEEEGTENEGEPGDEPGDTTAGDKAAEGDNPPAAGNEEEGGEEVDTDVISHLESTGAPAAMVESTRESIRVLKEEKDGLVKTVLAHPSNSFTEAQLQEKDVFNLRSIVDLISGNKEEGTEEITKPPVTYIGAVGNASVATPEATKPMGRPGINRKKKIS